MKITCYANNIDDITKLHKKNIKYVILGFEDFSRLGKLKLCDIDLYLNACQQYNIYPIFEWDILMTENDLENKIKILKKINFEKFYAIRTQDLGATFFIFKNYQAKIQLVLENGNHNLEGLKTYESYFGKRLERIVLSIQLPKKCLENYIQELKTPIEFLIFGRILLFYSPRHLLSPLFNKKNEEEIEALAKNEEGIHKDIPVQQNKHGTFLFNTKDFSLLEQIEELKELGISFARIEAAPKEIYFKLILDYINEKESSLLEKIKELIPRPLTRAYHKANKTDILFNKLKNSRLQIDDSRFIGRVIAVEKEKYTAILVNKSDRISPEKTLEFTNPEGKIIKHTLNTIKNSIFEPIDNVSKEQIIFIKYIRGITAKSVVHLSKEVDKNI